jgi:hypothetical protein
VSRPPSPGRSRCNEQPDPSDDRSSARPPARGQRPALALIRNTVSLQEARDPQRDIPRGILGSLVTCTVLYVVVSAVMVGLVPYRELAAMPSSAGPSP